MIGTLAELAERTAGRIVGDSAIRIERIASIDDVDATSLTFATDDRYLRAALASRAAAVLTDETLWEDALGPPGKPLLLVTSTRSALAELLAALAPARPSPGFVHPSAAIEASASVSPDAFVGPFAVVGARARVGAGSALLAGSIVGDDAVVGKDCTLRERAMLLERCEAGDRVTLQAGAVVGGDGFGFVFLDGAFTKIPQIGNVVLEDDVEIGANACVDRAQTGTTRIGRGTKIDNLVQVAHNCRIGAHSAFAAQSGLAGSTSVGDHVQVGGQAGFKGHITIGSRVKIAGRAQIWGDVPDDAFVSGAPAREHRAELRQQVLIRKLPKLFERVDALESEASRRQLKED